MHLFVAVRLFHHHSFLCQDKKLNLRQSRNHKPSHHIIHYAECIQYTLLASGIERAPPPSRASGGYRRLAPRAPRRLGQPWPARCPFSLPFSLPPLLDPTSPSVSLSVSRTHAPPASPLPSPPSHGPLPYIPLPPTHPLPGRRPCGRFNAGYEYTYKCIVLRYMNTTPPSLHSSATPADFPHTVDSGT